MPRCPAARGRRQALRASAGACGAHFSLRRTEYAGRGAGAPYSAAVIRFTRQFSPASSKIASAKSAHVQSPSARHVVDAVRPVEQVARRLSEVADVGRRAPLVVDHRHLVALRAEPEHRPDEVVSRRAEEPRRAHDPAVPHLLLALELRPRVHAERIRRVALDVRLALRAVEDVVGREVDDRRTECDHVPRPIDVHPPSALRVGLGVVHLRPGGGVEHELRPLLQRVRLGHVPLRTSHGPRIGEGLRQRRAELAAGAGDQLHGLLAPFERTKSLTA